MKQKKIHLLLIFIFPFLLMDCKTEVKDEHLPDVYGPIIVSSKPSPGDIDFPIDHPLTATFSKNLLKELSPNSLSLREGTTRISGKLSVSGKTLIFTPDAPLKKATTYKVTLYPEIRDLSDNKLAKEYSWSFETTRPPTVNAVTPANDAQEVSRNSVITITFSEAMRPSSINTSTIILSDNTNDVDGTVLYSNLKATFTPSSSLSPGILYHATVTTAVKDLAGNSMEANYTWSFKTKEAGSGQSQPNFDDFENYSAGSFPNTWTADANASDTSKNHIDNAIKYEGDKSLKLYGQVSGCWGALAYKSLSFNSSFTIELAIRNGNDALSGCHPDRGQIGLRKGTHWSNPARRLLLFGGDGKIYGGGSASLGTYNTNTWYSVKIKYKRTTGSQVKLSYWINSSYLGEETFNSIADENLLDNFEIVAQEGSAWFDAISFHPDSN